MKTKIYLSFFLIICSVVAIAQRNTNTGTNAGNSGADNTSIGYSAGNLVGGSANTFLGSYSGKSQGSSGNYNTFLGAYSGYSTNDFAAHDNFFGGYKSGYNNTTGGSNVFIGSNAGINNTTGSYNTGVGSYSSNSSTGTFNTYLGYFTNKAGDYNVIIGGKSGGESGPGNENTFIGHRTGYYNNGSGNVFIGNRVAYNEAGSNKLYIDNSDTPTPLIYGDFSTNKIGINSLPVSTHALTVGGTIHSTGLYVNGVLVSGDLSLWDRTGSNVYTQSTSDNIGIGTTLVNNPNSYKLAVNGKIGAKEVQIENTSLTWPDFVFKTDYKLMSLMEVESFIKANGHLPEVPSEKQVAEEGIKVSELNALLLQKIEELTLHLIELKKEVEALKSSKE